MNGNKSGSVSLVWFVIAAVILLLGGIGGFVYVLYTGITGIGASMVTLSAPGQYDVSLTETGTYTVFREFSGAENAGQVEMPGSLGLKLIITGPKGEEIQAQPTTSSQTYDISNRHGVGIMEFTVVTPGDYHVEASLGNSPPGLSMTLTLIHGFMSKLLKTIAKSVGVMLAGLLACALAVVGAVITRRPRKMGPPPLVPPPIE